MDWLLFFSALISSTLFPGGSEALLLYRLNDAEDQVIKLVLIATAGNVLGSLMTYGMGRLGNELMHKKYLAISEQKMKRAEVLFNKYGYPSLLLAWLPIVGDPLCLIAGLLRCNLMLFFILVTIGKLARYVLLALALPFVV